MLGSGYAVHTTKGLDELYSLLATAEYFTNVKRSSELN